MTQQRLLIYKIVRESCSHPTAEAIYERAKAVMPSIALGTVYRNLNQMVDAGEVRRISIPGEPDRFDKTLTPHGHMVCVDCGKVMDFSTNDFEHNIIECTGVDVLSYDVSMQVRCAECMTKERS